MKKINIYILLIITTMISSCSGFLTENPESLYISDNLYQNDNDIRSAVTGLYTPIVSGNGLYSRFFYFIDSGTDDNVTNTNQTGVNTMMSWHQVESTNKYLYQFVWNPLWEIIGQSNAVMENIEAMPDDICDSVVKVNGIAEAKFLRAWSYFHLVRLYGDVPKIDFSINDRSQAIPQGRTNVDVIYDSIIIPDLKYAEVYGNERSYQYNGHVNKWVSKLLLSQVYLTRAGWRYTPQGEWVKHNDSNIFYELARDKAQELLLDSPYDIYMRAENGVTPYGWAFDDNNVDNTESMWTLLFHGKEDRSNGAGNLASYMHCAPLGKFWYTDNGDFKKTGPTNTSAVFLPTPDLYYNFEEGDLRKKWGFVTNFVSEYNGKTYHMTPSLAKYFDPTVHNGIKNVQHSNNNIEVYRIAEAYLIYSEAENELNGPTSQSISYINKIRSRAGLDDLPSEISSNKDTFREAILKERRLELFGELTRRYDLVRTRTFKEKYDNMETYYKQEGNPKEEVYFDFYPRHVGSMSEDFCLLPIPMDEILSNPEIKYQNNGYAM